MILMGANPLLEPLEEVGPSLVAISGPKKVLIFRAHPFQWPSDGFAPIKSLRPASYKQQVH
jgi:hypothetical protein